MTRALVTQLVEAMEPVSAYGLPGTKDVQQAKLQEAITAAREYLATEPIGERAELIVMLRNRHLTGQTQMAMLKAADMLEADAQQATPYGWMVSGVPSVMSGSLAQEIQEQEAKRIGGTCKAFPVYTSPQQTKRVPMTEKQIDKIHADTARLAQIRTTFFIAFARAIEAHHGITETADKTTGWDNGLSQDYCAEFGKWLASRPGARQQIKAMFDEPEEEDLYALALKADNWGQP